MPKSSTLSTPARVTKRFVGLDVAVDDALVVRGREHVEELVGDAQHLAAAEAPVAPRFQRSLERLALEQLHHQEGRAVRRDVVVEDAAPRPGARPCWRRSPRAGSARGPSRRGESSGWSILMATRFPLRCVAA